MSDKRPGRNGTQISGILTLLGYFLIFCSLLLFGAAASRTWKAHQIANRWQPTVATIQDCSLGIDHPFADDGGGTIYYLRCHLDYGFDGTAHDALLRTTSTRSLPVRDDIDLWRDRHRSGSELAIRVNPSSPRDFVVVEPLPVDQSPTAREGLLSAIPFAILGAVLAIVGTRVGHRIEIASGLGTLLN